MRVAAGARPRAGSIFAASCAAAFALGCAGPQSAAPAAARPPTRVVAPMQPWGAILREPQGRAGETFGVALQALEPQATPAPFPPSGTISSSSARCPADMTLVADRVCVDRWEASLVERMPDGTERAWSPFEAVDGHEASVRAVSIPAVYPQGYISGKQAQRACMASGKRLCSAGEWETACRGPADTTFPYGDERRAGVCNDDVRAKHPVAETVAIMGLGAGAMWSEAMNEPLVNQLPHTLEPTGARVACTNDYGVYDMVGNLHEWIDDPDGTFRGGYYMDTSKNGDGCEYATVAHEFDYHDYSTGFRCCMDPDHVE